MPKLTFVIGATAFGKTYFINNHFAAKDVEILNVYDYQQKEYDKAGFGKMIPLDAQFRCLMKANDMHLHDIIEILKRGRNVVAEQTFYKAKRRIAYIDEIRKAVEVEIEVYVMSPSYERWKENIQGRDLKGSFETYKHDASLIEFPNPAEGFDKIFEVTDGEVRLRMDLLRPEILESAREELLKEAETLRLEDEEKKRSSTLIESMKERKFWHYCEVCGKKEFITAKEALNDGWDYPPDIGLFGLLGPRTCGDCLLIDTLFWKINTNATLPIVIEGDLSSEELVTWRRIKGEPASLLYDE
jgi:hypothetical protein